MLGENHVKLESKKESMFPKIPLWLKNGKIIWKKNEIQLFISNFSNFFEYLFVNFVSQKDGSYLGVFASDIFVCGPHDSPLIIMRGRHDLYI